MKAHTTERCISDSEQLALVQHGCQGAKRAERVDDKNVAKLTLQASAGRPLTRRQHSPSGLRSLSPSIEKEVKGGDNQGLWASLTKQYG